MYLEEEKQAVQSTSEPMSSEQKKQAIKKLIEQIPTSKEELFAYPIQWDYVDDVSPIRKDFLLAIFAISLHFRFYWIKELNPG